MKLLNERVNCLVRSKTTDLSTFLPAEDATFRIDLRIYFSSCNNTVVSPVDVTSRCVSLISPPQFAFWKVTK